VVSDTFFKSWEIFSHATRLYPYKERGGLSNPQMKHEAIQVIVFDGRETFDSLSS